MLGKKQASRQEDWETLQAQIETLVSRADLDALAERAVAEIRRVCQGRRAAFGWSGGKDSLVLEHLCALAGITECVLAITNLEYPAFLAWVTDHMPDSLEVVNTGQDLAWLARHPQMLFPQDAQTAARWFQLVQHTAQQRYAREHQREVLLLGRRRADGNYTGSDGRYVTAAGVTCYSPLRDWRHEDVLAFLHYHQVPLPPIYRWPNGYRVGTGPWPARQWTGSVAQGWREVYAIDAGVVRDAATVLPSARQFLKGVRDVRPVRLRGDGAGPGAVADNRPGGRAAWPARLRLGLGRWRRHPVPDAPGADHTPGG